MKKLLLPVILLAALASCKKDYKCTCTTKSVDTGFVELEVKAQHSFVARSKKQAQSTCDSKGVQQQTDVGDNTTATTCSNVTKAE